ncbi:hypothetical protein [Streptomyces sp. NPDC014676]|uniref:hypothetical protein n=1 Tax=Streptomyces sp. NPDC014676 TaxID=3364879 RepID=UPI0036F5848A
MPPARHDASPAVTHPFVSLWPAKRSCSEGGDGTTGDGIDHDTLPHPSEVVGQDDELSRPRGILTPTDRQGSLLLALDDPGSGKSTLLAAAADEAARRELLVLCCAGHEGETELVFAAAEASPRARGRTAVRRRVAVV